MTDVLIGSRALAQHFPEFKPRENSDWDIITEKSADDFPDLRVDVHHPDELNNRKMVKFCVPSIPQIEVKGHKLFVMNSLGLSILKRSHLWRDYKFDIHMSQYNRFLKLDTTDLNNNLLLERIELTKEMYKQPHPSLMKSNEDFFDDVVPKKYDHDWLHELAAFGDLPMYTKMKRDFSSAWCEKDMWNEFTYGERIMCVAEETYVIACERFMIPNGWKFSKLRAYHTAVKKVCTTLTSGWFRDFAIDNYDNVMLMFDKNKFDDIRMKIKNATT